MSNLGSIGERVFMPDEFTEESEMSEKYQHIKETAKLFDIPYRDMLTLASIESGFSSDSTSETGYVGMYQLNPKDYPDYDLTDYRENTNLAAEHYSNLPDGELLHKVMYFNQGRQGGREILAAHKSGKGVEKHSTAPWNRVKKMVYNLSDSSLNELSREYHKAKGTHLRQIGGSVSRESMIEDLVGHYNGKKDDTRNKFFTNKPSIVEYYIKEQTKKVSDHSRVVDEIIEGY